MAVYDDNDVAVAVVVAAATVPAAVAFADKVVVVAVAATVPAAVAFADKVVYVVVVAAAATTTTIFTTIAAAAAANCSFESTVVQFSFAAFLQLFAVIILASALSRNSYTFSFLTLDCWKQEDPLPP